MKKESVLKYLILWRIKSNRVMGIKLIVLQNRLKPNKLFNTFNMWERKILILWKPDLINYLAKRRFIRPSVHLIRSKDAIS